jgi:hypothetical protein
VVYEPAAIAWTEAPASLRQLWRQRYRWCYGTMQAMWKHRRALVQGGASGRLGRRGLGYLLLFQVLLPLTAPMVDIYGIYGLLFLPPAKVAAIWIGFTALQVATAGYALRLDREGYGPLWTLPFQQIVYRQLLYLVVCQATVMALRGGRLRWHGMVRIGAASSAAAWSFDRQTLCEAHRTTLHRRARSSPLSRTCLSRPTETRGSRARGPVTGRACDSGTDTKSATVVTGSCFCHRLE